MTDKHDFTIEKIKISPVNIDAEDEAGIREKILKLAHGHKKGETEIEVFKEFSSTLEQAFGAQVSTFSLPSEDYKHWKLHIPKDGNFDATPSRFSVSFYIERVETPTEYQTTIKEGFFVADCVDFMRGMDKDIVDLTVTSPPYDDLRHYDGYSFDFENIARQLYRVTKVGGIVVWVIGDKINGGRTLTSFRQGIFFQEIGFQMHDVMIYQKKNTPFMRSNAYTNCYEFMFVLSKGKPNTFNPLKTSTVRHGPEMLVHNKGPDGVNKKVRKELKKEKTRTNIWAYAVGLGGTTSDRIAFKHPAVFPEKLAEEHILSWTNEGDLVLDPMCGSGTTGKMALINNRKFIGVDISKEYVAIARKRMDSLKTKLPIK